MNLQVDCIEVQWEREKKTAGEISGRRPVVDWQLHCFDLHLMDQTNFGSGAIAGSGATAGGAGANDE